MRILFICTFLFLFLFENTFLLSQTIQQRNELRRLSEELNIRFEKENLEALSRADSMGYLLRKEFFDGQVVEIMGFEYGIPVYYTTHNAEGANVIHNHGVYPGGWMNLNLTGYGQRLGIWDGGRVRATHQEFMNTGISRVTQKDGAVLYSNHATHVAGTMIAGGVHLPARGMSYQASIDAYDWNNDVSEMAHAASDGLQVSQHSYGFIAGWAYGDYSGSTAWHWFGDVTVSETEDYFFGFYDYHAKVWDEIAYNAPKYLIVKSAGNDRGRGPNPGTQHFVRHNGVWVTSTAVREKDGGADGYNCISRNGNAKNILTVGAVTADGTMSSFSGWGPTNDGRIKPDIVAKGVSVYSSLANTDHDYDYYSGTSMSGPMVSGSVGLLLEYQANLNPGEKLNAATLKALIIHSADNMISGAPGPDYRYGWGMMNTAAAVDIMQNNDANNNIHIYEEQLQNNETFTIPVIAKGDEPLKATLVWTDPPAEPLPPSLNAPDLMLVNDLDMRITDSTNNIFMPYILNPDNPSADASTGDNFRDNVEIIFINDPVANEQYEISITHKSVLSNDIQDFSVIVTGNKIIECNHGWQAASNHQYNMQLIGKIILDDEISLNTNDVLGAFVNGECRGLASPMADLNGLLFLTVSSNTQSGEVVEFKIWDSHNCEVCETSQPIVFESLAQFGTPQEPFISECGEVDLILDFGEGFTWFSVNVDPGSFELNSLFSDLSLSENNRIIGQSSFANYFNNSWIGSLTHIEPRAGFVMELFNDQSLIIGGNPVAILPISLAGGFTWLGYLPQECLPVNAALESLTPEYDDRLIGQNAFALYSGTEWVGSLTEMCPGEGYMIKLANPDVLTYPLPLKTNTAGSKADHKAIMSPAGICIGTNFRHTMMLLAKLDYGDGKLSQNPKDVLYAFVDGECRGMASPMPEHEGAVFMNIGSDIDSRHEVYFKVWVDKKGRLVDINERISFQPLSSIGTLDEALILTIDETVDVSDLCADGWYIGEPYPNPFSDHTAVMYRISEPAEVNVRIYNHLGQVVSAISEIRAEAGSYVAKIKREQLQPGMYFIVVHVDARDKSLQKTGRVVVR